MTTRTVTMSHAELDRFGVITRVRERRLTQAALQDPSESMPQVTDLFYLERLEFLIETGALEVVKDDPEFLNVQIVSAQAK